MKDKKSLLLIVVCAVLVLTWVYHLYDKSSYSNKAKEVLIKDTAAVAAAVSDSLKKIFSTALAGLNINRLKTDTSGNNDNIALDRQLKEVDSLKNEVDNILRRKYLSDADWNVAALKIRMMRIIVDSIESNNAAFAEVKDQLTGTLSRLDFEIQTVQKNRSKPSIESVSSTKKNTDITLFTVSDIKLSALQQTDQKSTETNRTDNAEKLVASFNIRNNLTNIDNAEVVVVITDPAGKTLNPEVWDAGSFDTKAEGRKAYTRKIKFAYKRSELKQLSISLQPDQFEKGIYRFRLYQNGIRIGETNCRLN